jgi:hypothetical protein
MKYLLLIPLIGLAFCASSCRTFTTIDPMTGKPSQRCMPENTGRSVIQDGK